MLPSVWILTISYNQFVRIHCSSLLHTWHYPTIQVYLSAVRHNQLTTDKYSIGLQQLQGYIIHWRAYCHHLSTQGKIANHLPNHDRPTGCVLKNFWKLQGHNDLGSLLFGLLWFAQCEQIYCVITWFLWSSKSPLFIRCCLGQPSISVTHTRKHKAI